MRAYGGGCGVGSASRHRRCEHCLRCERTRLCAGDRCANGLGKDRDLCGNAAASVRDEWCRERSKFREECGSSRSCWDRITLIEICRRRYDGRGSRRPVTQLVVESRRGPLKSALRCG